MIEVNNLTKRYGQHVAVDNISFEVKDGEILGFLGPNGAGKTTTMNIITGYISSTEGSVKINGYDILENPEKAKKHIGYLPDVPPLYGDMTVFEYLKFVCDIKGVKKNEREDMLSKIFEVVKVEHVKNRLIKNLSKGYRQRVGLGQALVGFPEVIILDEPTNGLDPKQIIEMRDVIKDLSKSHTVILSSHILSEVSAVCDRVMIINKGKIVASDTPESLSKSLTQGNKILVRIKGEEESINNCLKSLEDTIDFEILASKEEGTFDISISGSENMDIREEVFNVLAKNSLPILMMKPLDLSLEEIFLQVTQNEPVEASLSEENIEESEDIYDAQEKSNEPEETYEKEGDE